MNAESITGTPRRVFYGLAVILLLLAVASAVVQKVYEGGVGISGARRMAAGLKETEESKGEVNRLIWNAGCWQGVGLTAALLALVSCGIANTRRENHRWVWVSIVVLLAFYIMLELVMV
jgi:hypothetical protein